MRDGAAVTDPVINDGTANYTPGISERRSSTSSFVHSDQLGSMTRLTNSSEGTTDTRQYDAYGMLVSSTGSTATPFGFAGGCGYQSDGDSGLMLLGHRYYDASTGRFITRDPLNQGRNWDVFCSNSPFRFVDPTGLGVWFIGIGFDLEIGIVHVGVSIGVDIDPERHEVQARLKTAGGLGIGLGSSYGISAGYNPGHIPNKAVDARQICVETPLLISGAKPISSSWPPKIEPGWSGSLGPSGGGGAFYDWTNDTPLGGKYRW
jgi:RHS repeat-associated protein